MDEEKNIEVKNNVFTEETHPINPIIYFFMSLFSGIVKIVKWVFDLLISMVISFFSFFKNVGLGIYKGILKIGEFFKRKTHQFKVNDISGKISYGIFGFSALKNKQYVNAVFYFLFEVVYIILFVCFGIKSIGNLSNLGSVGPHEDPDAEFSQLILGDNSIMILIYGLLWCISIVLFLYVWNRNINNSYSNYRINNYLKFEAIYKKYMEYDKLLDEGAKFAFISNISYRDFKKSKKNEITEYLNTIEDKNEKKYVSYLLNNSIKHTYNYLNLVKKEESKLDKINKKYELKKKAREDGFQELNNNSNIELNKQKIKVEVYNNKTLSILTKIETKINSKKHFIDEIKKKYSPYIETQDIANKQKYGKNNNYYNRLEELGNEELFYNHYNELKAIYNDGLEKFEEKNEENRKLSVSLFETLNQKQEATRNYYNDIRNKKNDFNNQIKEAKALYKRQESEILSSNNLAKQERLFEAKSKLIEVTTKIQRQINELPSDKNIKALEKEELKEAKRAYIRDKKYLKTNYKGADLGIEEVINKLVVDYKISYNIAKKLAKCLFIKDKNQTRFLEQNEIGNKLNDIKNEKNEYVNLHQDKYDVRFKTFIESVKSLFNEKFHITILILPIIGILLFSIVPLIFSIFIAFTNYSQGHQPPTQLFTWIGLNNFKTIFAPDADSAFAVLPRALRKTIGWTLIWAVIATFSNYFLGIIIALMINKDGIKFKKLWRTVFVMTIAIPQFISLLSIGTLLKDSGAIGTWYFKTFGSRLGFGSDGSDSAVLFAKFIIILVNVWVGIPYTILSTTGILLNIPKDLYESAKVDGAGPVTQFAKITMPYILFVTGPYLITQFIGNINNFNVIYFLTGGGPALSGDGLLGLGQTDLLITFIYKIVTSNNNPQYGIASAIGIIVFIICSFVSIVMYNRSGSIQEEDQFQ